MSTILLAESGITSSSKQMRDLNVRYLFVADKINEGEAKVVLCRINDMPWISLLNATGYTDNKDKGKILNLSCSSNTNVHMCVRGEKK